jgi:hypothetical protein
MGRHWLNAAWYATAIERAVAGRSRQRDCLEADERAEFERTVALVRAQLDAESFATAWVTGRVMTLEQAIAYAMDESPDDS